MIDRVYNYNWWSKQILKLFVMKFSSASCYFLLLHPAFPQEQSLLKIPGVCVKDKISGLYKRARDFVNLEVCLILKLWDVKMKKWIF